MARQRKKWRQETIEFRKREGKRGGRRKGAGRKPGLKPKVMHRVRRALDGRTPVHVTLRLLPEVGRLRRRDQYRAIRHALARMAHRDDCRVCQYSIQGNHLHLVVEPASKVGLSRGMISLKTSCARRLNGLIGRRGPVFADRYHARYLTSCAQVRRALCSHHRSHLVPCPPTELKQQECVVAATQHLPAGQSIVLQVTADSSYCGHDIPRSWFRWQRDTF